MTPRDSSFRIGVDIQELYDQAIVQRDAWNAFAEKIAEDGGVCTHPESLRAPAEGAIPARCGGCGRIFGSRREPEREDGR